MEYLQNGIKLHIPQGCFPLSTDSILLADFVRLPKNAQVLDLGSGCATLGLLLCASDDTCTVTGIELDPTAHEAALDNIHRNALEDRLHSICGDLKDLPAANCTTCITNPPYFTGGIASSRTPLARQDDHCSLSELFAAASRSLRFGGDLYLVHKPENLSRLCCAASACGLEPKRLRLIRHKPGSDVSLILLACRKGAKPGLVWEERMLADPCGAPSAYYKEIYHIDQEV